MNFNSPPSISNTSELIKLIFSISINFVGVIVYIF